jgi:hypothetical protein
MILTAYDASHLPDAVLFRSSCTSTTTDWLLMQRYRDRQSSRCRCCQLPNNEFVTYIIEHFLATYPSSPLNNTQPLLTVHVEYYQVLLILEKRKDPAAT